MPGSLYTEHGGRDPVLLTVKVLQADHLWLLAQCSLTGYCIPSACRQLSSVSFFSSLHHLPLQIPSSFSPAGIKFQPFVETSVRETQPAIAGGERVRQWALGYSLKSRRVICSCVTEQGSTVFWYIFTQRMGDGWLYPLFLTSVQEVKSQHPQLLGSRLWALQA